MVASEYYNAKLYFGPNTKNKVSNCFFPNRTNKILKTNKLILYLHCWEMKEKESYFVNKLISDLVIDWEFKTARWTTRWRKPKKRKHNDEMEKLITR